jgi:DNA-binding CsgD family transcriptional regulator
MNTFLSPHVSADILSKIANVTAFIGTPFLIFAWLMFIRFSKEITGRDTSILFVLCYIFINILIILCIGYLFKRYPKIKPFTIIKFYYIIFSFIYILWGIFYLLKKKKKAKFRYMDLKMISVGFFSLLLFQNMVVVFYQQNIYLALIFIFAYFVMGGFLPIYIKYYADLSKLLPEEETSKSFDEFCEKFEISKREKEIIHEICKGLTNQQIADKLFISLQTVKDHTHRIYSKMECTSRAQLMRIVSESL